jgi:flavin reductase (DIM6/NTAB) family NADH-FMN oxidoreductase RutF
MSTEQDFFRQVMGHFPTGVTIVTARSSEGLAGLTVNSFASVSLDPPLVLVCIDLKSHTLPFLRASGSFAVNFLTDKQENVSRCFATSSTKRNEYFCNMAYHEAATGSPIFDDILAFIDARIVAEYPGGDHAIFLGAVEAMGTGDQVMFLNEESRARSTLTAWHVEEAGTSAANNSHTPPAGEEAMPLAYYRGHYRRLASNYVAPSLAPRYEQERR